MSKNPRMVVGVPGRWTDWADIASSIASHGGGFVFDGHSLVKPGMKGSFKLEVQGHDPDLQMAFAVAGAGRFCHDDLQAIGDHACTLYLVTRGGKVGPAVKMLHAAHALLNAGGLAVKVESAGVAHLARQWAGFCDSVHPCFGDDPDLHTLFNAFVSRVSEPGRWHSCGMHNLGYADAVLEAPLLLDEGEELLREFLEYAYIDWPKPRLESGHTFRLMPDGAKYRLHHGPCLQYPPGDLFHNPFGVWTLTPK